MPREREGRRPDRVVIWQRQIFLVVSYVTGIMLREEAPRYKRSAHTIRTLWVPQNLRLSLIFMFYHGFHVFRAVAS